MSIIRELYYGNIKPVDQSFFQNTKEFQESQKALWTYQAKLYPLLNEPEKELFDKFSEAHQKLTAVSSAENFTNGFSLGLRIAFESMGQLRYIE